MRRRPILLVFFVLVALPISFAHAAAGRAGRFGLGLVLGEPTAISAKYWLNSQTAIDAGLAYDFDDSFTIFGDYLHHWQGAFSGQPARFVRELTPYLGIGGLFRNVQEHHYYDRHHRYYHEHRVNYLVLRIPVGIEWTPSDIPIGVFLELVPGIYIAPDVDAAVMGGIGIRYYF